ncbi:MAG TPA: hypothetical protein VGD56_13495 [Gemmatirosa sp.]
MPPLVLPGKVSYFEPAPREQLSQGDVFLAPSAAVYGTDDAEPALAGPAVPPAVGQGVTVRAWGRPGLGAAAVAPPVAVAVAWTPVMVLSHDCELDKEFNEHVDRYLTEHPGATEADAIRQFSDRSDLDRHVLVAPLLPYAEAVAPAWKHDGIRQAGRIGYLPVPPMAEYDGAEFFVHLARVSTVGRELLATRYKVASLSEAARSLLRFKLAEALASRNLSLVSKLEAAVGRTITDVRTMKARSSSATVSLVLDDGGEVQVDAKMDRPGAPPPERLRQVADE